jgi:hypothetical protein
MGTPVNTSTEHLVRQPYDSTNPLGAMVMTGEAVAPIEVGREAF